MCPTPDDQLASNQAPTPTTAPDPVDIMGSSTNLSETTEIPPVMTEIPPVNILDLPAIIEATATKVAEETVRQMGIQAEQAPNAETQQVEATPLDATPQSPLESTVEVPVAQSAPEEPPIPEIVTPTPTELIDEAVTAAHADMTETVAAHMKESEHTVSGKVVKHVTWQSKLQTILLAIVVLVLLATVIYNEEHAKTTPTAPLEEKKIRTPIPTPDIYKKISDKFTPFIKEQAITENEITEKIGEVVYKSEKVELLFKENQQKLREKGTATIKGIAEAITDANIITAVKEELPAKIKTLPDVDGYIKIELGKYAMIITNDMLRGL